MIKDVKTILGAFADIWEGHVQTITVDGWNQTGDGCDHAVVCCNHVAK